ncbi:MAG: hypothetical protein JSR73_15020 [Proteobacteria bacterium]|nr:hypothetical protein [Pseudomonadota bacterium]
MRAAAKRGRLRGHPGGAPERRFRAAARPAILSAFEQAVAARDGASAAECVHELWMRGEIGLQIEQLLARAWAAAAPTLPDWLPMRHVAWLPTAYEVAARCTAARCGRSNIYLVLLDYADAPGDPHGVYVGMSGYPAHERFDQHKAGIRAAGSVLKRGLEPLTGPVAHLQGIARDEAERIESELAEALRAAGIRVQGGH